jgi:hypothetical protein
MGLLTRPNEVPPGTRQASSSVKRPLPPAMGRPGSVSRLLSAAHTHTHTHTHTPPSMKSRERAGKNPSHRLPSTPIDSHRLPSTPIDSYRLPSTPIDRQAKEDLAQSRRDAKFFQWGRLRNSETPSSFAPQRSTPPPKKPRKTRKLHERIWTYKASAQAPTLYFFVKFRGFRGFYSFAHPCESARNDRIDLRSGDLTFASSAWASAEEEGQ